MLNDIETQIKYESSRAAQLSQEARTAFESKDWKRGKELMKAAVVASKNCQKLIQEFDLSSETVGKS
ncbi:MAG: hypothetical protein KME17_22195 [Cyanosarcina radialis HA8281-LM2]|jgi:hypothetical protein|nr:hypothetical protein [Cyanosarcina radialis HA8281-LM2]